jgi:hypothetical protein
MATMRPGDDGRARALEEEGAHGAERYLVIANKTGQLGNRLTVYAHMIGAARERGWTLLNPSFCEYAEHFLGTCGRLLTCGEAQQNPRAIPLLERAAAYRVNRLAYKCARVLQHLPASPIGWARASNMPVYELTALMDRAEERRWRVLFTQNYVFRQHRWCARHAAFIRRVFTPLPVHQEASRAALERARAGSAVLVGVHIRHGDYQHHLGGRFFFPFAAYAQLMQRMAGLLAPRSVSFLVCSNSAAGPEHFPGLRVHLGPGHLVADLSALAGCDWLLGPPSSFSAWAAFAGNRPLLVVEDPAVPFTLADFTTSPSVDPRY